MQYIGFSPLFARLTALGLALLAGCAPYATTPPSSGTSSGSATVTPAQALACNAQFAQFAVGQNGTASVMEAARVRSGAQMARILRPGQVITKEFDPQRLNLEINKASRIVAVRCG